MKNAFRPKETDLHRIWQLGWFPKAFVDIEGKEIIVIHKGTLNLFEGPDFFNAQIKVNDVLWCGSIEFHIKTSDYLTHQHQRDPNYNNVILHLVWDHDQDLSHLDHPPTFTALVNNLIPEKIIRFHKGKLLLPCENSLKELFISDWKWFKDKLLVERWESKMNRLKELHQKWKINEKICLFYIGKYYLSTKDQDAWSYYIENLEESYLLRNHQDLKKIHTFLFMNANIHPEIWQNSFEALLIEQSELKENFHFKWTSNARSYAKIGRCLAFVAELYHVYGSLQNFLVTHQNRGWKYTKMKFLGKQKWDILCINAFLPLSLIYNDNTDAFDQWQMQLLTMSFENNFITRKYLNYVIKPKSSADSQAIIQLYHEYCIQKKCLSCNFGIACLKK